MATKRELRSGRWEYIIKRKAIVGDKPKYFTFDSEEEGDRYIAQLYAAAALGVVPAELLEQGNKYPTLRLLIEGYLLAVKVPDSDRKLLNVILGREGATPLMKINYPWVQKWITKMKWEMNLSPSTIRHYIGAQARCFDWASNMNVVPLVVNPIRMLPTKYAQYNERDVQMAQLHDPNFTERADVQRDRRPEPHEEKAVRRVIATGRSKDGKRHAQIEYQAALEAMLDLALETAMRMREIYTLTLDQIKTEDRTIYLERTKNGNRRQVPLSSVAVMAIDTYLEHVKQGTRGMAGFTHGGNAFLPWWDGKSLKKEELHRISTLLSQRFARIHELANCPDLTFHDYRHEATSRFFERTALQDLEIMKITGHSSTRQLARYANLRASKLAEKLW